MSRTSATRIYYPELSDLPQALVADSAHHHLINVLRKKRDDLVCLFDGRGRYAQGVLVRVNKKTVEVELTEFNVEAPPSLTLGLAQAVIKGDRMDYAIQKAVELGVNLITPVLTQRVEVRLDTKRRLKKLAHWQQVIISACEQCGQNFLPKLASPIEMDAYFQSRVSNIKSGDLTGFVLSPNRARMDLDLLLEASQVECLVGPEGGLTQGELQKAVEVGFMPWQLGPRVLRAETAGMVASGIIQSRIGDYVSSA